MNSGIINILKPPGMTSHDVVAFIRRLYSIKRVGHAGTLDPAAAGVLPVAVGNATRLLEYMVSSDKSYRVELTIGYETDTGDDTGTIINSVNCKMPSRAEIEAVLASFIGTIQQVPPMYSAIKVEGKKLYELARAGITIERQPRTIVISDIRLLEISANSILFDVNCSKGTYIRSLCTDIGNKIKCPVTMSFLVRTGVGSFSLDAALTLEEILETPERALLPLDFALEYMPKTMLSCEQTTAFQYGQSIVNTEAIQGLIRMYDFQNRFVGIGQKNEATNLIKPIKVIASN